MTQQPSESTLDPVVLFTFKRPEHTRRTLEALAGLLFLLVTLIDCVGTNIFYFEFYGFATLPYYFSISYNDVLNKRFRVLR